MSILRERLHEAGTVWSVLPWQGALPSWCVCIFPAQFCFILFWWQQCILFKPFFKERLFSLDVLFPTKHLLFSLTYIPLAARPTQIIFLLSDTNQTHEYFRVHIFSRVGRLSLFPSQFFWMSGCSSSTKAPCWGRDGMCPGTWHGIMMALTFWSIFRHIMPLTHEKAEQPFITLCSSMRHHREWRELWCQKELASHLGCCFTPVGILGRLFPFSGTCVFISIICWASSMSSFPK